ncbi:hypothetical protein SNE25_04390 [Mucilaginibacter sabulilitoris]|uniref:Uncharacterized protein n=1 Tax=Mucilaginibacter sabulilitoris TaxID=1173583 RepID=A0ABZ0TRR8_9SPHI|nr:hypothetical protein [Mucilaginibacter sabulilitoris]WPU94758.1 hypothetical protein SNE25_04390 [Mucilaginibacter sabulilitoris]
MKSTNKENMRFSLEDFEKGLMLAGYLMPKSVAELNEREAVEAYEQETEINPKKLYFKRVVLAAEIVSKLNQEPTLGRIKFQKLVYLCENAAEMHMEGRYQKQAAGPFDNRFMHTIAREFEKNKWFAVERELNGNYARSKYIPLENAQGYKKYYENYFKQEDDKIQYIIELFRKKSTDYTEMATTIFACYLELKKINNVRWESLIKLFYDWSDKKKRFPEQEVLASFEWLEEHGVI